MPLVPPYPFILDMLNRGKVIPFLGAGASLGGRLADSKWEKGNKTFLPLGSELASHLALRMTFPTEEEGQELTKVAQYCSVAVGRDALDQELHEIFNFDYPLTSLHKFLANVDAPLLIVTTNYDDIIERAFDDRNRQEGKEVRPYDVVIHNTDVKKGEHLLWWPFGADQPDDKVNPNKLDINLKERTVIYKMHGAVDRRQSQRHSYVISEDDYVDFLARMARNKAVPSIFAEPFQTRHFLFLGYGLNDWNLRVVLNRIPKGIRSWAIRNNPRALETRFWQDRGVEVYNLLLDDFVRELEKA